MGREDARHIAEEHIWVLPYLYGVPDPWYPIRRTGRAREINALDKFVQPVESDENEGEGEG